MVCERWLIVMGWNIFLNFFRSIFIYLFFMGQVDHLFFGGLMFLCKRLVLSYYFHLGVLVFFSSSAHHHGFWLFIS